MHNGLTEPQPVQHYLIEPGAARSLLDQLLTDSRLYTRSKDYQNLLDFVVRLRNFAPFNAMLLQVQKPGLTYAASATDWIQRFGRKPKEGSRPLLILWPFGPVALVYDVLDTEGRDLPTDVAAFFAQGSITEERLASFKPLLGRRNIEWCQLDAGDGRAGYLRVAKLAVTEKEATEYRMFINRNHSAPVKFTTLAHELGHLFLGHCGPDKKLNVPDRRSTSHVREELEAESVAYMVCSRNGVAPKSQTYLANYVNEAITIDHIDIYQVMRAAGQVEAILGLGAHTHYEAPAGRRP